MLGRAFKIPKIVWLMSKEYNSWIVGGGAEFLMGMREDCKDLDVIIPLKYWNDACLLVPKGSISNHFGGFNFDDPETGINIDMWCMDLSDYANMKPPTFSPYAFHVFSGKSVIIEFNKRIF